MAVGLSMVDTIRGADFQARHLLLALDAGEPFRVARALAMEVAHRAVPGRRVEAQVKKLLHIAGSVAETLQDPYPSALTASASAAFSWSNGRWKLSLERADEAQRIYSERCASPSWETVTAQIFSMGALVRMGELNEHRRRMPALMRTAHERGNRYAQVSLPLLSYAHVTTLADDEPQQAAETIRHLIDAWSTSRYDLQRFWATYARAEICLYAGDGACAWREIETNARNVRDSFLLRVQSIRILVGSVGAQRIGGCSQRPDRAPARGATAGGSPGSRGRPVGKRPGRTRPRVTTQPWPSNGSGGDASGARRGRLRRNGHETSRGRGALGPAPANRRLCRNRFDARSRLCCRGRPLSLEDGFDARPGPLAVVSRRDPPLVFSARNSPPKARSGNPF